MNTKRDKEADTLTIPVIAMEDLFKVRGIYGDGEMTRSVYEEYQASLAARRSEGRYTLEEAALDIEREAGERADEMLKKLMVAAEVGALLVYEPGRNARYLYGPGFKSRVREYYEEAFWNDLNAWLKVNELRITWRFPAPTGAKANTDKPGGTDEPSRPAERQAYMRAIWLELSKPKNQVVWNEMRKRVGKDKSPIIAVIGNDEFTFLYDDGGTEPLSKKTFQNDMTEVRR